MPSESDRKTQKPERLPVRRQLFIDGRWRDATGGSEHALMSPATGAACDTVASATQDDVDAAVRAARVAAGSPEVKPGTAPGAGERPQHASGTGTPWSSFTPAERGRILMAVAEGARRHKEQLAALLREENGKTVIGAEVEVEAAARYIEYYAGVADKIEGSQLELGPGVSDYVRREPLGATGHIIPWNYPLDVFCRSVGPALAAGNTVVAKPSLEVSRATQTFAGLFEEAGLPPGVLNVLPGDGAHAGAALAGHPGIEGLVFTGSVETGRTVLGAAARNVTPIISIELGSKCPALIFAEEGELLDAAVAETVGNMAWNCGQSCGQRSRIYVPRSIYDTFVSRVGERLNDVTVGTPDDPGTQLGPAASYRHFRKIRDYIRRGREAGARELPGPGVPSDLPADGYYVPPTVFVDCTQDMDIVRDEIFGPVLSILPVDSFDEAIRLANDSPYGLSASVWTDSVSQEHRAIAELNVGHVTVNGSGAFGFEVPFGGVGDSGYGREGGPNAILAYTREKNVYVTKR